MNYARTAMLLAGMTALFMGVGYLIGGEAGTPMVMMPHNPPEYADYLEGFGLTKAKDLVALMLDRKDATPERFERLADRIRKRTGARIWTAAGLLGAIGSAASITSLAISPQAVTAIGESWIALMRVLFG